MNEPEKGQAVLEAMRMAQISANQYGHSLGEWRWSLSENLWTSSCKNCGQIAWVNQHGSSGVPVETCEKK